MVGLYMTSVLTTMLHERSASPSPDPGPPKIAVIAETADVLGSDGAIVRATQTPFQAFQIARQEPGRAAVPSDDPFVTV